MSFGYSLSSSCLWIWLWRGLTIFRHLQEWDSVVAQSVITDINEKSLKEVFDSREAKDKLYEAKVQRNEKWVIEIQVREEQQEKKIFCLQSSSAYSLWYSVTHSLHCKLWWFKKSQCSQHITKMSCLSEPWLSFGGSCVCLFLAKLEAVHVGGGVKVKG